MTAGAWDPDEPDGTTTPRSTEGAGAGAVDLDARQLAVLRDGLERRGLQPTPDGPLWACCPACDERGLHVAQSGAGPYYACTRCPREAVDNAMIAQGFTAGAPVEWSLAPETSHRRLATLWLNGSEAPKDPKALTGSAVAALAAANNGEPLLFVRGGQLATIGRDERGVAHINRPGKIGELRPVIERLIYFRKWKTTGRGAEQREFPAYVEAPPTLLENVLHLREWPGLPALEAIVEAPTLRADGTILDEPGYDADSRLIYDPADGLSVPAIAEAPSSQDVAAAIGLLRDDLLADFPFAEPADRANALALLLTPIVRPACGPVPLALLDAPRAGSGKGLLASIVARVATGRAAPVFVAPDDDAEWSKSITAMLEAGAQFVLIDEATSLRAPSLAAALTADLHRGRRLGHNEMIEVPQRATWAAAGNNIDPRGDLVRRCYRIRIDPKMAQPWTRGGFRHTDLEDWATRHRGQLLGALLTLARAWYAAGRPAARGLPTIGGFTRWTHTVGGILAHADVDAFLGNLEQLHADGDQDAAQWEAFLTAIDTAAGGEPWTTAGVVGMLGDGGALEEALPDDLAARRLQSGFKIALGKALRARIDTRHGARGLHVVTDGQDRTRVTRWRVAADHAPETVSGVQGVQGVKGVFPLAREDCKADTLTRGGKYSLHSHHSLHPAGQREGL